jgi:hypothetical protein
MSDRSRSRFQNAILFFAQNTRHCTAPKLFKLLYLLDFEHFRRTGVSVTGSEYVALPFGPAPEALLVDERGGATSFPNAIFWDGETIDSDGPFDDSHFTPRQLALMSQLADRNRDAQADEIDVTHALNGAWARVLADAGRSNKRIPYELSLADDDAMRSVVLDRQREERYRVAAHQALSGRI